MCHRLVDCRTGDLLRGALRPTPRSCCNHAILAGRLKQLGLWGRIGRALYHHMDLENLRVPKFDMDRVFCYLELSKWADFDPEASPQLGCPDQTGGHWDADGGQSAAVRLMDASLGAPAPISHCPSSLRFCMCRNEWHRYPQLSQTEKITSTVETNSKTTPSPKQKVAGRRGFTKH